MAGTVTLGPAYEGGPGLVHGGVLSLLFDHAMGIALFVAGHHAMTVSLEVRYRAPTPLDTALHVTAGLERVEGRKLFVTAAVAVDGTVTAEARGIFVALTRDNVARIFPADRVPGLAARRSGPMCATRRYGRRQRVRRRQRPPSSGPAGAVAAAGLQERLACGDGTQFLLHRRRGMASARSNSRLLRRVASLRTSDLRVMSCSFSRLSILTRMPGTTERKQSNMPAGA